MTHILPRPVFITSATLEFPENRDAPIAATIAFSDAEKLDVAAEFDWRQRASRAGTSS